MLWTPFSCEFQSVLSNFSSRPVQSPGTAVACGASNVKGSYVEIFNGTAVTHDVHFVQIIASGGGGNGVLSQCLMDVAIDPANGGSYTDLIPNLIVSNAGLMLGGNIWGGVWYNFPIFIPAGAQIGMRGQSNNAGGRTNSIFMRLFGKPRYPDLVRSGKYVTAFGPVLATSLGVGITPGTVAEGAWTDLSGADTTKEYWWWEAGVGVNDTGVAATGFWSDLAVGDGSNKQIVIHDIISPLQDGERISKESILPFGPYTAPAGIRPYGRMQSVGANESGYNMAAYGLGG